MAGRFGMRAALLAALVVVTIVLIVALSRMRDYEQFLSGFWVGDPAFLRRAGLGDMYLYLAPPDRAGGRQGYLVMTSPEGEVLSNQAVQARSSGLGRWTSALRSHFLAPRDDDVYRGRLAIAYDQGGPMPPEMKLGLSVAKGSLTLFDEDKVYAFLVRDNIASNAANELYRAENDGEDD